MQGKLLRSVVVLIAVGLVGVSGCKKEEGATNAPAAEHTQHAQTAERPAEKAPAADSPKPTEAMKAFKGDGEVVELTISGNDQMQFDQKKLTAKAGQMVRLTLKHTGQLPAQAMGHNVVILKQGEDIFEFGADVGEARGSPANNYVPEALLDRVVAYTKLIGGGQTAVVEFQVPAQAGEYPFLCSFPGHFGQMNGTLEVTQ